MNLKLFLLAVILIVAHQQLTSLPLSADLVLRLSLSMSRLQSQLQYFGTKNQNRFKLYSRVKLTEKYLGQLNDQLYRYNNVILGNGNSAIGNKNIIIGNYNNVTGSNNWVFVSNYNGQLNGDLLLGLWIIQIDKSNLILINPRFAISFIDQSKNTQKKGKMTKNSHTFCKSWKNRDEDSSQSWKSWKNRDEDSSQSQKSDSRWNNNNNWGSKNKQGKNKNNKWGSKNNKQTNRWSGSYKMNSNDFGRRWN